MSKMVRYGWQGKSEKSLNKEDINVKDMGKNTFVLGLGVSSIILSIITLTFVLLLPIFNVEYISFEIKDNQISKPTTASLNKPFITIILERIQKKPVKGKYDVQIIIIDLSKCEENYNQDKWIGAGIFHCKPYLLNETLTSLTERKYFEMVDYDTTNVDKIEIGLFLKEEGKIIDEKYDRVWI